MPKDFHARTTAKIKGRQELRRRFEEMSYPGSPDADPNAIVEFESNTASLWTECRKCKAKVTRKKLAKHMRKVHGQILASPGPALPKTSPRKTRAVKKTVPKPPQIKKPLDIAALSEKVRCSGCGEVMLRASWTLHIKTAHNLYAESVRKKPK